MTRRFCPRLPALAAAMILLVACAGSPPVRVDAESPPEPARDVIAEVRAAGIEALDGVEVLPLADPLVEDLRETAARQERSHAYAEADASLQQALALAPGDPELLQWRAELALALGRLDAAVQLADASWASGPRLGGLCRRNWATIRLARELAGLADAALAATQQGERCTVAPPVRM